MSPYLRALFIEVINWLRKLSLFLKRLIVSRTLWAVMLGFYLPYFFINQAYKRLERQDSNNKKNALTVPRMKPFVIHPTPKDSSVNDNEVTSEKKRNPEISNEYKITLIQIDSSELKTKAIDEKELQKTSTEYNKALNIKYSIYGIIFILTVITLIIFRNLNKKSDDLAIEESDEEKDPQDLVNLFSEYTNQITELGTPRKMKRFANKARLHYYQIVNDEDFNDPKYIKYLFEILLFIEKDRMMMLHDYDSFYKAFSLTVNNPDGTTNSVIFDIITDHKKLMKKIYRMNSKIVV